jgi:nucleoside-diphosphate-sugar epimerase
VRVLVTGASGFVGAAVVSQLLGTGHEVVGLARSDTSAGRLATLGAGVVEGSLADLDVVQRAAATSDGVAHLAFRHGEPAELAADTDLQVAEALGDALAGTGRPLVVTSGTLALSPGRVGRETDKAAPDAPAALRIASKKATLALAGRGIRVAVVRLAPMVHDAARRGFAGTLVEIAERTGMSGDLGDPPQRWPAVHRQDAASLYRLALEQAPEGDVLHGVGEEGISLRALAARIAELCDVPVGAVPIEQAEAHFGWLTGLVATDAPASRAITGRLLGWEPSHRELIDDLAHFVEKVSW